MHILFIHGAGNQDTDDSSQPLLRGLRAALPAGTQIDAPVMPDPDNPDATAWGGALRDHMGAIAGDFVAVGHSLGASTILKTLAETGAPVNLRGVVTLAMPYWGEGGWGVEAYAVPAAGLPKSLPLILYYSTADQTVAIDHLDLYLRELPHAVPRRIAGTDHLFDRAPFTAICDDIALLGGDGR